MANFYQCEDCGEIVLEMGAAGQTCPSQAKHLITPNSTDAAAEKHVPVVRAEGECVKVQVGSALHPMTDEHHISWIFVKTSFGGSYCNLCAGDPPEALLHVKPSEVLEVYAYCNLHGLWKAPSPVFELDFGQNDVACSAEFPDGCVNPSAH